MTTPPARAGLRVERLHADLPTSDLDAVDAVAHASFDASFSVREELTRAWSRLWLARVAEGTPPVCFVATWHVADELHLLNIATAPSMRRLGLARALMEEALRYADAEQVRLVLLEVRRSNRPAIKLYRGLGFRAFGVRKGYYADNGEDAVEMMLALDAEAARQLAREEEIPLDA